MLMLPILLDALYRVLNRRIITPFNMPIWQRIIGFYAPRPKRRRGRAVAPIQYNHPHSPQKPEWLKAEIIRLKARMPQAGCRTIADICNRRFAASRKVTVGKTWVHQVLQRHDYEIRFTRRNLKHARPKAVPRNLIWGVDLTGKVDTNKNLYSLFGILDHGSRALLYLQALHDKTSHTLIACIGEVIRIHGKPKIIRTDNEAIFTSRIFRLGLKKLGIRHQRTTPGCPWQNGRIERLFGTLKQKLDQLTYPPLPQGLNRDSPAYPLSRRYRRLLFSFASSPACGRGLRRGHRERVGERASQAERLGEEAGVREQINRDLGIFRYWYNHIRPHQNLDGRTPAEAWKGINPYTKPAKQEQWFEAWDGLLTGYELRR